MTGRWLTARECEVLLHLASGESFKWIGHVLNVSPNTAETFAKRAYAKLGVSNRYEAVARHPRHRAKPLRLCHVGVTTASRPSAPEK